MSDDWLVERGIGEDRALLIEDGAVVAARLLIHGEPRAGALYPGRLVARAAGANRGTVLTDAGFEVLVDKLPRTLTEGSAITVRLTRAPIAERGRFKRAQGRVADDTAPPAPHWTPREVAQLPAGSWDDVWLSAAEGRIAFSGGELLLGVTPAMTVIDIDGDLPPPELALAAVPAIARALRWFDIGGSVGIDFPTLAAKPDRAAVDAALGEALADWPHERTAMNGFGFVQLVARLEGPSLLHRFARSRVALCARQALRCGERTAGHGPVLLLTVHPALRAHLRDEWLAELARRTGKQVRIETDPALALEVPQAQFVAL